MQVDVNYGLVWFTLSQAFPHLRPRCRKLFNRQRVPDKGSEDVQEDVSELLEDEYEQSPEEMARVHCPDTKQAVTEDKEQPAEKVNFATVMQKVPCYC